MNAPSGADSKCCRLLFAYHKYCRIVFGRSDAYEVCVASVLKFTASLVKERCGQDREREFAGTAIENWPTTRISNGKRECKNWKISVL